MQVLVSNQSCPTLKIVYSTSYHHHMNTEMKGGGLILERKDLQGSPYVKAFLHGFWELSIAS